MPVRSLNSPVLKWPDREAVLKAARTWAADLCARDEDVKDVFCVGSYARGDWGVGSDVDVIVIISDTTLPLLERRRVYEPAAIPVDADVWVYTQSEWSALQQHSPMLWRRLQSKRLDLIRPRDA